MAPIFYDTFFGVITMENLIVFVLSGVTALAVGLNRLSWIPIIISGAGLFGNTAGYLAYYTGIKSKGGIIALKFIAETGWNIQETIAVFYSYFLLERVLHYGQERNRSRFGRFLRYRYFFTSFWVLTICNISARITITAMYMVWWLRYEDSGHDHSTDTHIPFFRGIEQVSLIFFLLTALTEMLTGFFLIRVFRTALRTSEMYCGGQKVGLFRKMALSAELRVSSLAAAGVTRAAVARIKNRNHVANEFEYAMWYFGNAYAFILVLDILLTRVVASGRYVMVDKVTRTVIGEEKCVCGAPRVQRTDSAPTVQVDSSQLSAAVSKVQSTHVIGAVAITSLDDMNRESIGNGVNKIETPIVEKMDV